ncbi:hypothetical protein TWF718_009171 [Orbilia javanica]|uniref:Uncharacterized protein n=1 Tax=Orbilia javanica TaxID=47235 RepID=A0AAN8MUK1_9PEZI
MARRPRNQFCASDSASAPAPPAASSGKKDDGKSPGRPACLVSEDVEARFKGYMLAAQKAEEEARANRSSSTGWGSPASSPSTKASSLATTAGNKGKGKKAAIKLEIQAFGAEQWLALPAGVRLADAYESPKSVAAPAPKGKQPESRPIATANSKRKFGVSLPASKPLGPAVPVSGPNPPLVSIPVIAAPALVAKTAAPQKQVPCQTSKPKEPRVVDSVVYLPVEMEGVVYHKNPKIEYRDFDGDVVMQDLFEAPLEVPKKLDQVLGQRKFKRQFKQKSKISARVIRMAEEEIKRMRKSS